LGLLTSIIVISFLIFFHELGHFLAARYFGVSVQKFSIGFGKKIYSKVIGETEYMIAMIPLGGYVQMKGQDDLDPLKTSDDPDSYNTKKPWQKIIILLAGPFANFLIAFVLFLILAVFGAIKLAPMIGEVVPNSPAHASGLLKGDKIVQINRTEIKSWSDLSRAIKESEGTLQLIVERDSSLKRIVITPQIRELKNIFGESIQKRAIGVAPSGERVTIYYTNPIDALSYALNETYQASKMILQGIQKMIAGIISIDNVGGIISIVQITSQASQAGILALLTFTALLSVNLGVLNLLPIPALDGGHIIFNLYEMLFKQEPSEKVFYYLTISGWGILIGLMTLGIYNDINRIVQG
jgi:regulator of sigma E protease